MPRSGVLVIVRVALAGKRPRDQIHLATDIDGHTLPDGDGGVMSKFERLLEVGATELPDCRCVSNASYEFDPK